MRKENEYGSNIMQYGYISFNVLT